MCRHRNSQQEGFLEALGEGVTLLFELARLHSSQAFQSVNVSLDGWTQGQVFARHPLPKTNSVQSLQTSSASCIDSLP